jgi:hypothetical protein
MKAKYQIAFLIVVGAYFLLNGLIPRNENINWQMYSNELQQDG